MTDPREHPTPQNRTPHPQHAAREADRLTGLTHDLNTLLDGSLRWLELATRTLDTRDAGEIDGDLEQVRAQLGTVRESLKRMADLVGGSMRGTALPLGSPFRTDSQRMTLGDLVSHAVDVLTLTGEEHGVRFEVDVDAAAAETPGGRVYPVLLNGIRNAIESIAACNGHAGDDREFSASGGCVRVEAVVDECGQVVLSISDDGHGPPTDSGESPKASRPDGSDPECADNAGVPLVFRFGYTTKPHSLGVGLALSHDLVSEIGGRIELVSRTDRAVTIEGRPGAVLRVVYPAPKASFSEGAA